MRRIPIIFGAFFVAVGALAHQSPAGWTYPGECCSNQDCREVAEPRLSAGNIWNFNEGFAVPDSELKPAGDGRWHLCVNGSGKLLCAFGPKGGA